MALMEQAAGQGHAYAMHCLGTIHHVRGQHVLALEWYTKSAEAGLPDAMLSLGCRHDTGEGMAAPDYPAAAGWYRRAANAGNGGAANKLSKVRSRQRWGWHTRNQIELGLADSACVCHAIRHTFFSC